MTRPPTTPLQYVLHPYYKPYCELAWADKPGWLEDNNRAFQELWAQYKVVTRVPRPARVVTNDIDDAIDSLMELDNRDEAAASDLDEYER
jgi:hypothetical protein